jgi:hypothetical protein
LGLTFIQAQAMIKKFLQRYGCKKGKPEEQALVYEATVRLA